MVDVLELPLQFVCVVSAKVVHSFGCVVDLFFPCSESIGNRSGDLQLIVSELLGGVLELPVLLNQLADDFNGEDYASDRQHELECRTDTGDFCDECVQVTRE